MKTAKKSKPSFTSDVLKHLQRHGSITNLQAIERYYPIVILVLSVILAYQYGMNQAQSSLIRQLDCDRHYQDSVIINLLNNGK